MRTIARVRPRRAAATCALVLAGTLAGVGAAAGERAVAVTLAYTCAFPSGEQPVSARIAATFPDEGTAGAAIETGVVAVAVTLPEAALADLTALGAASVAGTVRLSVTATQNATSADAAWSGLTAPPAPIPAAGEALLDAAGTAPAVTAGAAGAVEFTAGGLVLELAMSTVDGTPAEPASLSVACALDQGQNALLATVAVPDKETAAPTSSASGAPEPGIEVTPDAPRQRAAAADPIPPECGQIELPPRARGGCAYVAGYANIRKLNASILVLPTLTNIAIVNPILRPPLLVADNPAEIVGGRVPPLTGTFHTFGFMPITATLDLIQDGPINIHTEGRIQVPLTFTVTVTMKLAARVYDVKVNGVPLDVGENCRPERSLDIVLTGGTPEYTNILRGGPLAGMVEIPPFSGCGVTEDLDPLFTGTVSGPGNRVKVLQGNVCVPVNQTGSFCPPRPPVLPPPDEF